MFRCPPILLHTKDSQTLSCEDDLPGRAERVKTKELTEGDADIYSILN